MLRNYNENERIIIRDVLEPDFAEDVEWEYAYLTQDGPCSVSAYELKHMTPEQKAVIGQKLTEMSGKGYSFAYFRHRLGNTPYPALEKFYNFVAGPRVLEFISHITGDQTLARMSMVATRYNPSCFLRTHNDHHVEEGRKVGQLWGFTRNWDPDWGGTLQFLDADKNIIESHVPEFNTLSLFKVPSDHFVSLVAPYAHAPRFVLSGWFHE